MYWRRSGTDRYGAPAFDGPIEIDCRWENKLGQVLSESGELVASKATVYVDRQMFLGDKLKEGSLESDTPEDPKADALAFDIQGLQTVPNLKAKEFLYIAML